MMVLLRQFFRYLLQVLKQYVFLVSLFVDIAGLFVFYRLNFFFPTWILILITIIALIISGFNVYRQSSAEIEMILIDETEPQIFCENALGDRVYYFKVGVQGHLSNFGLQTGAIENISCSIGFNNIFDKYLLSRLMLSGDAGAILHGTISPNLPNIEEKEIPLPFVIKSGDLHPFTMIIKISIEVSPNEEWIWQVLDWLKCINLLIDYQIREGNRVNKKKIKYEISTQDMFEYVLDTEGGMQSFRN